MIGILLLGENWYGSCPRACCYALRLLGCDVLDIDSETAKPPLRMRSSRAALRLFKTRLMSEYKRRLLAAAAEFKPEFLLAFKDRSSGQIRSAKCAPPALPFTTIIRTTWRWRGTEIELRIPDYHSVFDTKRYWDSDTSQHIKVRRVEFYGYDPEIHRRFELDERDLREYVSG